MTRQCSLTLGRVVETDPTVLIGSVVDDSVSPDGESMQVVFFGAKHNALFAKEALKRGEILCLTQLQRNEWKSTSGFKIVNTKATNSTEAIRLGHASRSQGCLDPTFEGNFRAIQAWARINRPELTRVPSGVLASPPSATVTKEGHTALVDLQEGPFVSKVAFTVLSALADHHAVMEGGQAFKVSDGTAIAELILWKEAQGFHPVLTTELSSSDSRGCVYEVTQLVVQDRDRRHTVTIHTCSNSSLNRLNPDSPAAKRIMTHTNASRPGASVSPGMVPMHEPCLTLTEAKALKGSRDVLVQAIIKRFPTPDTILACARCGTEVCNEVVGSHEPYRCLKEHCSPVSASEEPLVWRYRETQMTVQSPGGGHETTVRVTPELIQQLFANIPAHMYNENTHHGSRIVQMLHQALLSQDTVRQLLLRAVVRLDDNGFVRSRTYALAGIKLQ